MATATSFHRADVLSARSDREIWGGVVVPHLLHGDGYFKEIEIAEFRSGLKRHRLRKFQERMLSTRQ